MIQADFTPLIKKGVEQKGYGFLGDFRMKRTGSLSVYARQGKFVSISSLIKIDRTIDEAFQAIKETLELIKERLGTFPLLIFQGGPQGIVFPDWFQDWISVSGIEIDILHPEDLEGFLDKKLL